MLDRRSLIANPAVYQANADAKGEDCDVARVVALDAERKGVVHEREALAAELNRVNKAVGPLIGALSRGASGETLDAALAKASGGTGTLDQLTELADLPALAAQGADALRAALGAASKRERALAERVRALKAELAACEAGIPNLAHAEAPKGIDETDNRVVSEQGATPVFAGFKPRPHFELGEALGLLHPEVAGRLAGSGFSLITGDLARLERALLNFFLDLHTQKHGYVEVNPPHLVNEATAFTTGYLPKMREDMYFVERDGFFLIPTAEAPLTSLHAGEILTEDALPKKYTAYTPCYRREAGAAGSETRGLLRVHQFNKVELFKLVTPETSDAEHLALRHDAEECLALLGLPYRVLELCTGDLSFAAARCWDLEVFAGASQQWLEVSSVSTFTEFQARRGNLRYRDGAGKVRFCHTINGSGLATPRVLVTIMENFQRADGRITVPDVLRPYLGGQDVVPAEPR